MNFFDIAANQKGSLSEHNPVDTYLGLRAFVDELVRCGVRIACTSPGSRSTPVVLTLAWNKNLRTLSHIDERCSAFFALGSAKDSGVPAVVTCTSGTAAVNFAPAVFEAYEARVPLLVLTTDRPPELRELGAGQTIDQVKLYGSAAKWCCEVDDSPATPERMRWLRQLACRAFWMSIEGRPGPIHINFSLREPLVLDTPLDTDEPGGGGRPNGRPWVTRPRIGVRELDLGDIRAQLIAARRVLVIAGRDERDLQLADTTAAFAQAYDYPLLADPISNARRGETAIAHYDLLIGMKEWRERHRPDLVIRIGDLPTSKPLRQWLAVLNDVPKIAFDCEAAWHDPTAALTTMYPVGAHAVLSQLTTEAQQEVLPADTQSAPETKPRRSDSATDALDRATNSDVDDEWLSSWKQGDAEAAETVSEVLHGDDLTEPAVVSELAQLIPANATLFVASSMPIRDVESLFPVLDTPPRVLSNRGANGIDGTISTAFGVAASSGKPTVLLIGDVALAYEIGGLLAASRLSLKLVIVLINNDGGGIFHFLPVANQGEAFEQHVATPHGLDFSYAAALYKCDYQKASTRSALRQHFPLALESDKTTIIEVLSNREQNLALHREIRAHLGSQIFAQATTG